MTGLLRRKFAQTGIQCKARTSTNGVDVLPGGDVCVQMACTILSCFSLDSEHVCNGYSSNVPMNAAAIQLKKIVMKWLNEHPKKLHLGADVHQTPI